jgi:peptidoglycan lytic transglycosylase G
MKPGRNNKFKFWVKSAVAAFVLVVFLLSAGLFAGYSWFNSKLDSVFEIAEEDFFIVPPGASIKKVAGQLEAENIVESAFLFRLHMRIDHRDVSIKAGEYRFFSPVSIRMVAEKLIDGDIYYHRITVPEGLEWQETAAVLSSQGFGQTGEYLDLIAVPDLIRDLDPEAENLEGYLFPETYFVTRGTTPEEIIGLMVGRFRKIWTKEFQDQAVSLDMSPRAVITLASLIEKETSLPGERILVSSVFHNRLEQNIKLACDPTVIYAVKLVKPWDGIIHLSDLRLDSPYNTYIYTGLPPGPIANPGLDSVRAALYPEQSDLLFFVSKNDGSHIFSTNYRDHADAVRMYQR